MHKSNNWLDQWRSGKLGTGSRIKSFPRAFLSSNDVSVLLLNQPDKAVLIRVNTTSSSTNTLATFVLRIDDFFRSYCKTNRHYLRFDFSVISSSTRSLRPQSLARLGELVKIPFHSRKFPATVHVRCQLFGLLEQVSKTRRHFEGRNH